MADPGADLAVLLRWQASGAPWRIYAQSDQSVTISLCDCVTEQEVERFVSSDPQLLAYLRAH